MFLVIFEKECKFVTYIPASFNFSKNASGCLMIFGVNISKAPLEDLLATGDNGAVL